MQKDVLCLARLVSRRTDELQLMDMQVARPCSTARHVATQHGTLQCSAARCNAAWHGATQRTTRMGAHGWVQCDERYRAETAAIVAAVQQHQTELKSLNATCDSCLGARVRARVNVRMCMCSCVRAKARATV
jgi:hypothetical protein